MLYGLKSWFGGQTAVFVRCLVSWVLMAIIADKHWDTWWRYLGCRAIIFFAFLLHLGLVVLLFLHNTNLIDAYLRWLVITALVIDPDSFLSGFDRGQVAAIFLISGGCTVVSSRWSMLKLSLQQCQVYELSLCLRSFPCYHFTDNIASDRS